MPLLSRPLDLDPEATLLIDQIKKNFDEMNPKYHFLSGHVTVSKIIVMFRNI
jgi:hypothetical protein